VLTALDGSISLICNEGRLASIGDAGCGTERASCLIRVGDNSPVPSVLVPEGSTSDGTGPCDLDNSARALTSAFSSEPVGEPIGI
jgi:hypothetical protein